MNTQHNTDDFDLFRGFLLETSGIELASDKEYLVESRLGQLMDTYELESWSELVEKIRSGTADKVKAEVIDAMTTNETLWFRDQHPFTNLTETILPELANTKSAIKIWSAACSTGQEPYSIAMCLEEFLKQNSSLRLDYSITATDVSESVLSACREGRYDEYALGRGLPDAFKKRYFEHEADGSFRIEDDVRHHVSFGAKNLLDSFNDLGEFDVVFCRNVLIYFPSEIKRAILEKIYDSLVPGGYLLVGASEGLSSLGTHFKMITCPLGIIYRKI
ncbi:MAG: protein-glutamate O-methyltransferase CheR [Pseudomonadales bacterium]|nr:protein-glutamate O-methyltransferase CheR [Pseudomonadales bacterium]